jgi:hypothetical protein
VGIDPDLDGELFVNSSSSAVFAAADTLASCAQYLEPILRGVFTTYAAQAATTRRRRGLQRRTAGEGAVMFTDIFLLSGPTYSQHTSMLFCHLALQLLSSNVSLQGPKPCTVLSLCCLPSDLGLKQWQLQSGDAVAAVNCLYELVQQHQQVLESREHAEDELHKAKVGSAHTGSVCRSNSSTCTDYTAHASCRCPRLLKCPSLHAAVVATACCASCFVSDTVDCNRWTLGLMPRPSSGCRARWKQRNRS